MGQYLIDNNAISNFFSELFTEKGMDFMAEVLDQTPAISVITEIEALSWVTPDKSKEDIVKAFVKDTAVLALTPAVALNASVLGEAEKLKYLMPLWRLLPSFTTLRLLLAIAILKK